MTWANDGCTDGHCCGQVPAIMSALVGSVDQHPPATHLVPPVTHFMKALAPACLNPVLRFVLSHCDNR